MASVLAEDEIIYLEPEINMKRITSTEYRF
jgi:hypothetical protein